MIKQRMDGMVCAMEVKIQKMYAKTPEARKDTQELLVTTMAGGCIRAMPAGVAHRLLVRDSVVHHLRRRQHTLPTQAIHHIQATRRIQAIRLILPTQATLRTLAIHHIQVIHLTQATLHILSILHHHHHLHRRLFYKPFLYL